MPADEPGFSSYFPDMESFFPVTSYRGRVIEDPCIEGPWDMDEEDDFIWMCWVENMFVDHVSIIMRRTERSGRDLYEYLRMSGTGAARTAHIGNERDIPGWHNCRRF